MEKRFAGWSNWMGLVGAFAGFSVIAGTAEAAVDCTSAAMRTDAEYRIPGAGYWMQAVDQERITYTSVGGSFSYMYNFKAAKAEPITNYYDAFPIPPGDIYVHPVGGYSFYKTGDGTGASALFSDPSNYGVYQAIGLLPATTGPEDRYVRVSAGWGAGVFQDYNIKKKSDGKYEFKKLHATPVQVCRNLQTGGLDTQIPVLARNGEMIAGRDTSDQMTKIYRIKMTPGASKADCELLQTIPTETSKISFSFTNNKVMFVIADATTTKGRLLEMEIATGKLTTLSTPVEDVMYMTYRYDSSFRNDDMLLFSRRMVGSASVDASDLIMIRPNSVAQKDHPAAKPLEALGLLWGGVCKKEFDTDYARAVGSRLKTGTCGEMIDEAKIKALPEEYRVLKPDQLLALCNSENRLASGAR